MRMDFNHKPLNQVQVRSADPRPADADNHIRGPLDDRVRHILKGQPVGPAQGLIELMQYRRFHGRVFMDGIK